MNKISLLFFLFFIQFSNDSKAAGNNLDSMFQCMILDTLNNYIGRDLSDFKVLFFLSNRRLKNEVSLTNNLRIIDQDTILIDSSYETVYPFNNIMVGAKVIYVVADSSLSSIENSYFNKLSTSLSNYSNENNILAKLSISKALTNEMNCFMYSILQFQNHIMYVSFLFQRNKNRCDNWFISKMAFTFK